MKKLLLLLPLLLLVSCTNPEITRLCEWNWELIYNWKECMVKIWDEYIHTWRPRILESLIDQKRAIEKLK